VAGLAHVDGARDNGEMDTARAADIEAITTLKSRYCHCVDRKRWSELAELFTVDAELHKTSAGATSITRGRDDIVRTISTNLATRTTMHYATNPVISVGSATEAEGSWCALYMSDDSTGHGWYDDEFVCRDGRWFIAKLHLTVSLMR
jgi:SnoaL-like domain